ncbi:MAG: 16S rRNA (cytosine(967)-C(5))-methyltransferase RsmB [Nitrospirae bacterium]|nr:16S rRNA (cytosine(967)-C(5))-methyltransferase RsmB [Nitrospirota bacterium]
MAASPARSLASRILLRIDRHDGTLKTEFASFEKRLDPRELGLCREIVYGVERHRAYLDWALSKFLKKPLSAAKPEIVAALRIGAYQMLMLDRIPVHSAVNESVELVKKSGSGASGLVNAVLRSIARNMEEIENNPPKDTATMFSHPQWLVKRWIARYGEAQAEALCRANNEIPHVSLRVNRLATDRQSLLASLREAGIDATPSGLSPDGIHLPHGTSIASIPQELHRLFQVQDDSAQLVAPLLRPEPGERILDACAAPGGKATHLAELSGDKAEIVAVEKDSVRMAQLGENIERLGFGSIRVVNSDLIDYSMQNPCRFDKILLDAPCSALGVIRRNPDIKWRRTGADLVRNNKIQGELLEHVSKALASGGKLLYAVCSNEPEEGLEVINTFLKHNSDFQLEETPFPPLSDRMLVTMPHIHHADGFFAALLTKKA